MVLVLIQQILVMVAMMAVGFVLVRTNQLTEEGVGQLSNVALYVATPCLILRTFAIDYVPEQLVLGAIVAAAFCVLIALSIVLARVTCGPADRVGAYAVIFSNSGFVGIPIITALLGEQYVFYVSMTIAGGTLFAWTYGVWLMTGSMEEASLGKVVTNPVVISVFVGLALFLLPIRLPMQVSQFLDAFANLNTGVAMIVLGANLGMSNIALMVADTRLYKASLLRLLAVPAMTIVAMLVTPLPTELKTVLLIVEACPAGAATAMMAQKFGADHHYGTGLVIMTTLLSMVTMPVVLTLALRVL